MSQCIVVVGYNNVRIYDVAKLREVAARDYGVKLALITEQVKRQDHQAADALIACDFSAQQLNQSHAHAVRELARLELDPIGVLPFSDRGTLLGASLATCFSLPGVTVEEAAAGLDKRVLRRLEQGRSVRPTHYRPVFSRQVDSLDDFRSTVSELGGLAFIKPANEGNSRGCSIIRSMDECDSAWQTLAPYRIAGVIVEELVDDAQEYSWDYVAGYRWITEKHTTQGEYRAEYQQIVPAPLPEELRQKVDDAGFHIRRLASQRGGAFHNEIFLRKDGTTSAVETNMRPAGMHIWDLAARSFSNFDPWKAWVHWAITGESHDSALAPVCYSGIRAIRAPTNGRLESLPDISAIAHELSIEVDSSSYSKKIGDTVTQDPKDNSEFVGEITLHSTSYVLLCDQLERLANAIEAKLVVAQINELKELRRDASLTLLAN
jgi:biotin carboxylase